jgi:hypothetical protein
MGEPAGRRLPWGLLLTGALLALLLVLVYRIAPGQERPAPWPVVFSAGAAAAGAFLFMRRLQGYFWGLAAALTLGLHPLRWEWSASFELAARSQAMELIVLAAVAAGWDLVALPRRAWRSWLAVAGAMIGAGALAWPAVPQAGLVTGLLTLVGLPLGVLLTALRHRERPSWLNGTAAVVLGLAGPPLALLLGAASLRILHWSVSPGLEAASGPLDLLSAVVAVDPGGLQIGAFTEGHLQRWAWPAPWLVLGLLGLGVLFAGRRGMKQFAGRRPPLPWLLLIYSLVVLIGLTLGPRGRPEIVVPLAGAALLLSIFGAAELLRVLTRPLLLPPPGERAAEENP